LVDSVLVQHAPSTVSTTTWRPFPRYFRQHRLPSHRPAFYSRPHAHTLRVCRVLRPHRLFARLSPAYSFRCAFPFYRACCLAAGTLCSHASPQADRFPSYARAPRFIVQFVLPPLGWLVPEQLHFDIVLRTDVVNRIREPTVQDCSLPVIRTFISPLVNSLSPPTHHATQALPAL